MFVCMYMKYGYTNFMAKVTKVRLGHFLYSSQTEAVGMLPVMTGLT